MGKSAARRTALPVARWRRPGFIILAFGVSLALWCGLIYGAVMLFRWLTEVK